MSSKASSGFRKWACLGKNLRFLDQPVSFTLNVHNLALRHSISQQGVAEECHRITLVLILSNFLGRAVTAVNEQTNAVFIKAIGLGLDQCRPLSAPRPRDRRFGSRVDGLIVLPIDDHTGNAVTVRTPSHIRLAMCAGGWSNGRIAIVFHRRR